MSTLSYAVVTPARDEADRLPQLADCLVAQTRRPAAWIIVDDGSTDRTTEVARVLASEHPWISLRQLRGEPVPRRGAPVVRAFNAGLDEIDVAVDIVVKLDADLSFDRDHFARLLAEFDADPSLGIAGGLCWEKEGDVWKPQYTTRNHVRGAEKAYRRACFSAVFPLEQRMGWDGIDEIRAAVHGWRTRTVADLRIDHHRSLGGRESAAHMWIRQGEMAHYMWYRPSYLALRAFYRARKDPRALAMIAGYAAAVLRRDRRLPDRDVRDWLRREQGLRRLRIRAREALGRD